MKPKKHLGQNFLKSESVLNKIIEENDISGKTVIEIGPGMGALTNKLTEAQKVYAFEIDSTLKPHLDKITSSYPHVEIVYDDILNIDLNVFLKDRNIESCVCIANIPYYITGSILKLIASTKAIVSATLMMQKEVGERLLAKKGKEYGALSVLLQYKYNIKKVTLVKKTAFYPVPKVDSIVIKLDKIETYVKTIKNEDIFVELVKASFLQKRKTLLNNLTSYYKIPKEDVLKKLRDIDPFFNEMERAENVSLERFVRYANGWNL